MLVDDSPSERRLMRTRLQSLGHHIVDIAGGIEAITHLSEAMERYDLILLDVCMPYLDGLETARRIRAIERSLGETWRPIIFLSGRTTAQDIAAGVAAGGDDYLAKPVDTQILEAKIAAMQRIASMRHQLLETKQQLAKEARTDELTGVANRRHFMSVLDAELARSKRQGHPLTLVYLDLDHFKQVNDNHGHDAGDQVLRSVTATLTENLRQEDTLGRIGGEEFSICMPGTEIKQAHQACERYRGMIERQRIELGDRQLQITASIGLTDYEPFTDSHTELLARADSALYQAKQQGRNRVEIVRATVQPFTLGRKQCQKI
jgi:diguanylate cyclase (GGDEF)-like protein